MSNAPLNITQDAIHFVNTAATTNRLNGLLTIGHDRQRRDQTVYELHWGADEATSIGATGKIQDYSPENIGTASKPHYVFNQPLIHQFNNTAIPAAATHLLVFVTDTSGQKVLYASRPLIDREHLLPPSATQLERHLAAAGSRLGRLPVLLDTLWDPSRCPADLLPWLGWATSNDIWFDSQSDAAQESLRRRQLIRKSAFVHQHKGTRAAIQQALDAFANVSVSLTEWWQQNPKGYPHTFVLDLLINGNTPGIGTVQFNNALRSAIDAIKPARSHYSFTISVAQAAGMRMAAGTESVSYKRFNMAAVLGG